MPKTNVYILTRESKAYSDEGLIYVANMLKKRFDEAGDLEFCMGAVYNNPEFLSECLLKNKKSYVVVSTAENIIAIAGENIYGNGDVRGLMGALADYPERSSWETAYATLKELLNDDENT